VKAEDIEAAVANAGLDLLPPGASDKFAEYLALLLKWNARLNLTAIREPAEIVRRHFLECIQCAQAVPEAATLLDFGSGAGFPGIPISLVRREIHVTLGESQAKKAAFLWEAVRCLGLNASVFDGRIEAMPPAHKFEVVTLRAVDKMAEACALASDRLADRGTLLVFATTSTEAQVRNAARGISWQAPIPLVRLKDAFLMIGRRES
jgi:16S rRNA (guanine527-N7)-methyltransferase